MVLENYLEKAQEAQRVEELMEEWYNELAKCYANRDNEMINLWAIRPQKAPQ